MDYTSFEDLEVWNRSARLAVKLYDALVDCHDYGLKDSDDQGSGLHRVEHRRGSREG